MVLRAWKALLLFLLVACAATGAKAQTDFVVVDIEVQGNRIATSSLILGVSSIARGSPLTAANVQSSIHRLYDLGIFSDVQIKAEEVTGGLKVLIVVTELPKLTGIEFSGNKKIKDKDLKEKIGLGVGGYISPYLIHEANEKIVKAYAEKGYFQASAEHSLTLNADTTEAILSFKITERSKVKVKEVVLTGTKRVEPNDLVKKMRNRPHGFLKSSDFAQEKYPEDKEKIIAEYRKKGYLDAQLLSDSMYIDTAINRMTIYLDVYEGPLYYFGDAAFEGNEKFDSEFLGSLLKFEKDKVFNIEKYDESVYELYTAYQDIGHLHVRIQDERTTRQDSVIDIRYVITEGLPSHINLVHITGNTRTKDFVIRREMSVRPGQIFNRSLLIRSVRDIMALNFFANVVPEPINLPSGDVDIEFKVEEKQTGQVSAGAGYNSQDKVVGSIGMGIPNFRGNGQNLSFNIDFGSRRNSFQLSFTEPWLFGRPTLLGADLFVLNRRWYDDYTEGRQGGSIRLGRRLRWPDNYFRLYASYRLERTRFFDLSGSYASATSSSSRFNYQWTSIDTVITTDTSGTVIDTSVQINNNAQSDLVIGDPLPGTVAAFGDDWHTASKISLSLIRDSRNLPEFATKGSMLSYQFENTGGLLGGYWQYQRHRFEAAKFIPLIGNIALAARVQYGVILGASSDPKDVRILISDRFSPGGTAYEGIVRGYDDGDLTPDSLVTGADTTIYFYNDPDSISPRSDPPDSIITSSSFKTRVRGKYMLVANAEIQIPISQGQLYTLLFFDAGNSWLKLDDVRPFDDLYKGAGVGFRLLVPGIGTIGFDFAYPLDQPPDGSDKGWRPHFQIGTTFR